ncbi:hypothetical protein R3P38DRAFT_2479270, partial [Favolaschia claudopus]
VLTGEEDETTVLAVFGKLFQMEGDQWKERGVGTLKLNSGGVAPRLLMRNNKVHKIILNVKLFPEMWCTYTCTLAPYSHYVRFGALEGGVATQYTLR